MEFTLDINGKEQTIAAAPTDSLMSALRSHGYFSVRYGSDSGETGAAAILVDGSLVSSEVMLVAQAAGHRLETVEGLAPVGELHPIQKAFIETGAIQSGYSTPAMILAAKSLLDRNTHPTESDVRDVLSGILCRETGYVKPVEAVLRAAAYLRGEDVGPYQGPEIVDASYFVELPPSDDGGEPMSPELAGGPDSPVQTRTEPHTDIVLTSNIPETSVVGKPEIKVDAIKLAKGNMIRRPLPCLGCTQSSILRTSNG
jgi:putative selenate reductase molybdopterin-binding subunit